MQVITANRLIDGRVVFFTAGNGWDVDVAHARVHADQSTVDADLVLANADVDARKVVEPYAIVVEVVDGRPVPKTLRERIRAGGPTIPSDFSEVARSAAA